MNENVYRNKAYFRRNLKLYLEKSGMTQKELAKSAEISETALCFYLKGERMPDYIRICRICKALKITPNDILRGVYG